MPATRTTLTNITPVATPGQCSLCPLVTREDPANVIKSSYIVPWDPVGHHMETATYACHDFTLLAMFLALFFLLFASSSHVTQVTLQENNKNII